MARSASSFRRPGPSKQPRPTVLIVCEDTKSGKCYIEDAAVHFRVKVKVEVTHCGRTDPKGIVQECIRQKGRFDRVFCVVDRDSHQGWNEALGIANDHKKLKVVASYPCFEYWLILHFNANRKPYVSEGKKSPGECCVEDLRKCPSMDGYEKGRNISIFNHLLDKLSVARRNSPKVLADALQTADMNPSSALHELIDYFEQIEKEMP